jgi:hypothetical protein
MQEESIHWYRDRKGKHEVLSKVFYPMRSLYTQVNKHDGIVETIEPMEPETTMMVGQEPHT